MKSFCFTYFLSGALLIATPSVAQMAGGNFSGQAAPKEVKASDLSKGAYTSDVNLFNGTMATSYDLGTVSTPSGLRYNLQLTHSSVKSVGGTPLVVAGIPYGEGWNLNVPTITISNMAYHKYSDQQVANSLNPFNSPQQYADYSISEFSKEGDLSWYAPVISIPGVVSERFIFKAFDPVTDEAVFVPNKMEHYVEARMKYGSYWKVTDHNGDVYSFTYYSSSYREAEHLNFTEDSMRTPPSFTAYTDSVSWGTSQSTGVIEASLRGTSAHLNAKVVDRDTSSTGKLVIQYRVYHTGSFAMQDNLLPKQEINTWYCNYIYNKNAPMGQQISFHYYGYGTFDYYGNFNQKFLNQQLSYDYHINSQGSIPAFKFTRDVVLQRVASYYQDRGMIEEIELIHQTVNPGSGVTPKNMLLLTEPSVQRLDSLYNYRIVYSQGVNTLSDSAILGSNAYRHTQRGLSFNAGANVINAGFGSWRRYLHVMSDAATAKGGRPIQPSSGITQHHPAFASTSNPFLFANGSNAADPYYKYDAAATNSATNDLPFDHAFLESPRIEEDMIPGDIYEVRSVIRNYNVSDTGNKVRACNFDINIVSGYPLQYSSQGFIETGDGVHTVNQSDYESGIRGVNIFNTFGNPLKWTSYANTRGADNAGIPSDMVGVTNTSNFFMMPTLPKKYKGINIQVGPANADIDYALDQRQAFSYAGYLYGSTGTYLRSAYFAYKKVQEDATSGQHYANEILPNPHHKPSAAFGIGMPWYMLNSLYSNVAGSAYSDDRNNNYRFWWKDGNDGSAYDAGVQAFSNQPTAANDQVSLSALELVRYSKNPWMLVSVRKYKYNGYAANDTVMKNKYLVSQLNLSYEVKVDSLFTNLYAYDNLTINHDTLIGCITYYAPVPGTVIPNIRTFKGREFVGFQNTYLLGRLTQIPVNGAKGNAAHSFTEADMPTTHFRYQKLYADSLARYTGKYDFTGNLYTVRSITDQLGGVMEYEYYSLHDTRYTRWMDLYKEYALNGSGMDYRFRYNLPGPDVYKLQVAVKSKRYYNTTASALPAKTWRYSYSDGLPNGTCEIGLPVNLYGLPPNTTAFAKYKFHDLSFDFGFRKTTVSYPPLSATSATPYDVYTHYTNEQSGMIFGKLKTVEKFDGQGKILHKKEYLYNKSMAFPNFAMVDNQYYVSGYTNFTDEYSYRSRFIYPLNAGQLGSVAESKKYELSLNTDYELTPFAELSLFPLFKPLGYGHYTHCYFVRLVKEISTDYDYSMAKYETAPLRDFDHGLLTHAPGIGLGALANVAAPQSGNQAARRVMDKPLELFSGLNSIRAAISQMPAPQLNPAYFGRSWQMSDVTEYEYWDADSTGLTASDGFRRLLNTDDSTTNKHRLLFEPSWELFRTKSYSPELAGAYKNTEHYYYYDLKQDIHPNNPDYPHPEKFDALYYSHKYGIRNVPYQKRFISKAVSQPEVSRSTYFWYDTRTKTDTVFVNDTLYINGPNTCPPPVNPPSGGGGGVVDLSTIGCIEIPHPYTPPPAGYTLTQVGPNSWMYCPDPISNPGGSNRPFVLPSDLHTKLLLRRVDEQVDTVRTDLAVATRYYPVLRFYEYTVADPVNPNAILGFDYNWRHNYAARTSYRTLEHTPMGFVRLDMNERLLKTRYHYHTMYSTMFLDVANPCNNGGAFDFTNQGVPESITVGAGEPDSLTTHYKYNPDFTIDSILDPNNLVMSYGYDAFSRLELVRRNDDTLSFNTYSQWLNDTALSFEQRAAQNYVESLLLLEKGSTVAEHSRAYVDPLGRKYDVQTQVTPDYTNASAHDSLMVHSGLTTFDNWDRPLRQYKPFKYVNGGSPVGFAPRFNGPGALYTEQQYEPNQRGNVLRAAKFGESLALGHTVNSSYQIIQGTALPQELGPYYFVFLNEITGTTTQAQLAQQRYLKTAVMDEDGKKTVSYTNAMGQKVASKSYASANDELVTAFVYDSPGNLTKVVDPRLQSSTWEYNLCGNLFRKVSGDADTARYLYDVSGNVVLEEDANGAHGVDETATHPYLRKYTYDKFNRLVKQDRMLFSPAHNPLRYSPAGTADSGKVFYSFTHASSLDYVTGWMYEKCLYVYRPVPTNPSGPVNPQWPPIQPPLSNEDDGCTYLYMNPYDSLTLAGHEKAWSYHFAAAGDADLQSSPLQQGLKGRLSMAKSYTHAGAISNLNVYSYNGAGLMAAETVQFNKPGGGYQTSLIRYAGYNLRNSLTSQYLDVDADGTDERHYNYTYDGWNRLREVKIGSGSGATTKLAAYTYDDALGLLKQTLYYDPRQSCAPPVDTVTHHYDARNRLTELNSVLYNEKLYYDLNGPQTAQAAFAVGSTSNFNGNINGLAHSFRAQLVSNYAGTAGIMDSSTVYGYHYDGANRLSLADASVLNVLNYNAGSAVYGPKLAVGDEQLQYSNNGNISTLQRGLYKYGSSSVSGQHWNYGYEGNSNRLSQIDSISVMNSVNLRNYSYDMNGNQVYQRIGKSKASCDYMRSNLPKHIYGKRDTTASAYSDLYYEYNNHDDRIYKKVQNSNGSSASTYYLRDASGKELAEWDMINNSWIYYAYGRDRVAELEGSSGIVYYTYDHLGSVRVVYDVTSDCLGSAVIYKLDNMSDYYAFGKTLRTFGGDKYGYQGSEKNKELGDHDYYTHFRGLDVEVARWKGVDPLADQFPWQTPYSSMDNNPVMNVDQLGNSTESTHTDKNGRVVAVYNDGDKGVYKHDDLSNWDQKSTLLRTGEGVKKMGETKYWDEFKRPSDGTPSGAIDFGTSWDGLISTLNKEAVKFDLMDIATLSKNNRVFDIKSNKKLMTGDAGVYTGRLLEGKYATLRTAGNYLAGLNGRTGTLFGAHVSQTKYMMLAGALQQKIFTKTIAASIVDEKLSPKNWWPAPYYGEEPYSGRAILDGWNSLDKK